MTLLTARVPLELPDSKLNVKVSHSPDFKLCQARLYTYTRMCVCVCGPWVRAAAGFSGLLMCLNLVFLFFYLFISYLGLYSLKQQLTGTSRAF